MDNLVHMADKKTHTVGARVDEQTYKLLESIAKEDERTVSWLLGKIIDEWLKMKGYKSVGAHKTQKKKTNE
ncbi:MAG TPA: hypothetical protein VI728_12320 [Syntrophales bacterium]|nr:hypothetical protein [Syntrophales bacterium]